MFAPGYSVKNTIKFFRKNGTPENCYYSWAHVHPRWMRLGHADEKVKSRPAPKRLSNEDREVAREVGHPRAL